MLVLFHVGETTENRLKVGISQTIGDVSLIDHISIEEIWALVSFVIDTVRYHSTLQAIMQWIQNCCEIDFDDFSKFHRYSFIPLYRFLVGNLILSTPDPELCTD